MMSGSKEQVTPEDLLEPIPDNDEGSDEEFMMGTPRTSAVPSSQCEPDTKQDSEDELTYYEYMNAPDWMLAQPYDINEPPRQEWRAPSGRYYKENVMLERGSIPHEDSLGTPHWTWEPVRDTDMVYLSHTSYPLPDPVYVWRAPSGIYYRSGQLEWSDEIPAKDRNDTEWTWEVDVNYDGRERLRHHSTASESKRDDIPPAQPQPPTTSDTDDSSNQETPPLTLDLHISPSPPSSPDAGPSSPKRRRTNTFSPINIRF